MAEVAAPHGVDDDGKPLAPYGYLKDGVTPRKGNRGARPGARSPGRTRAPRARAATKIGNRSDKQRVETLVALIDMTMVTPLAGLAMSPTTTKRFGQKHASAFAGDAVILSHFSEGISEGLVVLSQSKPGVLSWLDNVEENAPYLMLANVGLQMVKALVENHLHPNEQLARAGGLMMQMKLSAMAEGIEQAAAEQGIFADEEPTTRIPEEAAA
jgi:hypothetical protein